MIKFANKRNRRRVSLLNCRQQKIKELCIIKNDNDKLSVEVIIVMFSNAVVTVDIHTASKNDVKLVEIRT